MLYSDFKTKMIRRTTNQKSVGEITVFTCSVWPWIGSPSGLTAEKPVPVRPPFNTSMQGGILCKNSEGWFSLILRCCLLPYN